MKHIENIKINSKQLSSLIVRGRISLIPSILLLICLLLVPVLSKAQVEGPPPPTEIGINVSSPDNGDNYCPYKGVTFTAPTNFSLPKYGYITYNWTFNQATIPSYSSASNQINYNPNPPLINWDKEGTFTVTVSITTHYPNGTIAHIYVGTVDISINATCCGNNLLSIPALTGTQTTLSGIYHMSSNLTIPNGHSLIITGTVLVEGDAIPNTGPGGTVGGNFFFVEQGASFEMDGGEVRAHCESMWGGVEVEQDAKVEMVNSDFKDSFFGIYPNPNNSDPYQIAVDQGRFFNNRQCITGVDIDATTGYNYINRSVFNCNPETFLSPFEYNSGHNAGEEFRTEYGVKFLDDSKTVGDYFAQNEFRNSLTGVQIRNGLNINYPYIYIKSCIFDNIQFAGVYAENRLGLYLYENNTFSIPISPNATAQQYSDYVYNEFSHVPEGVYGVIGYDVLDVINHTTFIDANSEDDPYFANIRRVGIWAHLQKFASGGVYLLPHTEMYSCNIKRMRIGVDFTNEADYAVMVENEFTDNMIALHYNSDPVGSTEFVHPQFHCNKFELVNPSS